MLFNKKYKDRDKKTWDAVSRAALMGTNMVASTIVGLAIGYYLDQWLGTTPWMLIFWLLMGIIQGFRGVYLESMKIHTANSQDDGGKSDDGGKPEVDGKPNDGGKPDV